MGKEYVRLNRKGLHVSQGSYLSVFAFQTYNFSIKIYTKDKI